MIDAGQRHIACVRRHAGRGIVNLDIERRTLWCRSSSEQHATVLQERCGMAGARDDEIAAGRPGAGRWIVRRDAIRERTGDGAARHEHTPVRQRDRGGAVGNRADISGGGPGATRHLRDISSQDQPGGGGQQCGGQHRGDGLDVTGRPADVRARDVHIESLCRALSQRVRPPACIRSPRSVGKRRPLQTLPRPAHAARGTIAGAGTGGRVVRYVRARVSIPRPANGVS